MCDAVLAKLKTAIANTFNEVANAHLVEVKEIGEDTYQVHFPPDWVARYNLEASVQGHLGEVCDYIGTHRPPVEDKRFKIISGSF